MVNTSRHASVVGGPSLPSNKRTTASVYKDFIGYIPRFYKSCVYQIHRGACIQLYYCQTCDKCYPKICMAPNPRDGNLPVCCRVCSVKDTLDSMMAYCELVSMAEPIQLPTYEMDTSPVVGLPSTPELDILLDECFL